jgi:hypothetical protein
LISLECINNQEAAGLLMKVARDGHDIQSRSRALNAIANTFYHNGYTDSTTPDKEIVHLLISNLDDTTYTDSQGKPVGQIAREGIINWLAVDPGEPQGRERIVSVGTPRRNQTISALRDLWWARISNSLEWNKGKGRFVIQQ